jgi:tetrahydromethanopterin S-methyltransferase subunit G
MAKEPDNIVLKLLREIRDTQGEHSSEFKKIRKELEDLSESVTYSLGLSAHANVRHESVQKKIDEIEKRLKKLEARNNT